jgi:1,2-diacylglycerol 3-alpha-glucosyltransferase
MNRIAVIFRRLGPYHVARLEAAARHALDQGATLHAVELARTDTTYAWAEAGGGQFERETLFVDAPAEAIARARVHRAVWAALDRLSPGAVAVPGWSFPEARAAIAWGRRRAATVVLMSESAREDAPRRRWREWLKRRTVRACDAALVGGSRHGDYAMMLGMPAERIFRGYDVVDNAHFTGGAAEARRDSARLRAAHGLPADYILASGRFVEKKNFVGLLRAFAEYRSLVGERAWSLVLCGDGPLRTQLEATAHRLGLHGSLHLPGFLQYDQLPIVYGLARAFVLPSTVEPWGLVANEAMAAGLAVIVSKRCGCAPDLVREGENGLLFDPLDSHALAEHLTDLTEGRHDAAAMGAQARMDIARWSPELFAESLWCAVEAGGMAARARTHRRPS